MTDQSPTSTKIAAKKPTTKTEQQRKKIRGIADTIIKYEAAGWSATHLASKAQMDIFATKGEGNKQKIHFVKVIDRDIMTEPSVEETNQYIQNAFSNMAEPIYAYVYYKNDKLDKILLDDVNTAKSVRLIATKTPDIGDIVEKKPVEKQQVDKSKEKTDKPTDKPKEKTQQKKKIARD
jgi:hypothetical protein